MHSVATGKSRSVFEADRGFAVEVVDEDRLRRLVIPAAGYPDGFFALRMRQANRQPRRFPLRVARDGRLDVSLADMGANPGVDPSEITPDAFEVDRSQRRMSEIMNSRPLI